MPAIFQKALERTLQNHQSDLDSDLQRLDKENLAIKIETRKFARLTITWLGFKFTKLKTHAQNKAFFALIQLHGKVTDLNSISNTIYLSDIQFKIICFLIRHCIYKTKSSSKHV